MLVGIMNSHQLKRVWKGVCCQMDPTSLLLGEVIDDQQKPRKCVCGRVAHSDQKWSEETQKYSWNENDASRWQQKIQVKQGTCSQWKW